MLIELPEDTGTDLRFLVSPQGSEPVAIVEQTVSDPVNGRRTWALKFDRRMRGDHLVQVSLVQPHTEGEDVTLPVASFIGAERQNGWVAVEAREEQSLRVTALDAAGQPLLRVDPIDLPGMGEDVTDRRRIVAGVRYVRPGYTVTVAEESFDPAAVPTALADRLSAVSVLSESGLMQHQLDVTFRAVGMQSLRFVLPEGSDVWAVLIDGTPAEVRQAGSTYQVPLSTTGDPSASRSLRLIYRSHVQEPGTTGRLRQSPPLIAAVSGAGQTQPLEVLKQNWTLHYPQDVVLLNSRGLFAPTEELLGDDWLTHAKEALTLPTLVEAGWKVGISAAVVLLIACVLMVRQRFGFASLVVILVAVPAVFFVAFLFYTYAVQERFSADFMATTKSSFELRPTSASPYETNGDGAAMGMGGMMGAEGGEFSGAGGGGFGGGGGMMPPAAAPESAPADDSSIPLAPFGAVDPINGGIGGVPVVPQSGATNTHHPKSR